MGAMRSRRGDFVLLALLYVILVAKDRNDGRPLIHRDLKPDNVLIGNDLVAKVADFGSSRKVDPLVATKGDDGHVTMTQVGTPMYCAPEITSGSSYNEKVDVYSFGITLLLMACEDPTFVRQQYLRFSRQATSLGRYPSPPHVRFRGTRQ